MGQDLGIGPLVRASLRIDFCPCNLPIDNCIFVTQSIPCWQQHDIWQYVGICIIIPVVDKETYEIFFKVAITQILAKFFVFSVIGPMFQRQHLLQQEAGW